MSKIIWYGFWTLLMFGMVVALIVASFVSFFKGDPYHVSIAYLAGAYVFKDQADRELDDFEAAMDARDD